MQDDEVVRRPAPERSPFDRLRIRGLLLVLCLGMVAGVLLFARAVPEGERDGKATLAGILVYLLLLAVLLVRGGVAGVDWRRLLGPAPRLPDLPLVAIVVPLALLTAGAITIVFVPVSYIAPDLVERVVLADSPMMKVTTFPQFFALLGMLSVAAPVVEEVVFRGLIMHRLARKYDTTRAVLTSSALFAMLHVEWVGHFILGVGFALIYLRTRSLWMSMLAHGVYNALAAIPIGWAVWMNDFDSTVTSLSDFRGGLVQGVVMFAAGMLLMYLYLDLYWPAGKVAQVVSGPMPYDAPPRDGADAC